MKTESYNASQLETEITKAITALKKEIEDGLTDNEVTEISSTLTLDNPTVLLKTKGTDGDPYEIVKVIQRPDTFRTP